MTFFHTLPAHDNFYYTQKSEQQTPRKIYYHGCAGCAGEKINRD